MAGAVTDIAERTMILRLPMRATLMRAIGLPRSVWGTAFAHFGIGVTLLGIVAVTAWGSERIAAVKPGETVDIAHYRLTFDGVFNRPGPNYRDVVGHFTVRRMSGDVIGAMEPSRRTFPARNMATTEAALMSRGFSQLYLSLGDPNPDGTVPVRLFFKPQVLMIWLGAIIMFFGGGLSLSDRRLRVGAPRPAKAKARTSPRCRRRSERREISASADAADRAVGADKALGGRTERDAVGPGFGSARPRAVQGIALHGVPERVDRRFRSAAGP